MRIGPIKAIKFWKAFRVWPNDTAGSKVEIVLIETWAGILDPRLPVRTSDAKKAALEKLTTVAEICGFKAPVQKFRLEVMKIIDQGIIFTSFPGNQLRLR